MKDYCTLFPEYWFVKFTSVKVYIGACCKNHDNSCSTRKFYLCLKDKIGKFHATYIGFGGSIGCWFKYTKFMLNKTKGKK